ncbi:MULTISPECIES: hypothetical protein [Enterococcus]|uniref:hypothetical protein n=1 Tax=Enterococcus TaxID=1350 RepID=UPI001A9A8098|nr:hypothetical protein [Enterococcus sp. 665A]MBO1341252.1 hypothetical protein [Enterococcus sp. 665A]
MAILIPKEQDIVPEEDLDKLSDSQDLSGISGEFFQGDEEIEELTNEEFEMLYQ